MSPPHAMEPLTPSPPPLPVQQIPAENFAMDEFIEADEDLPPNPVLPFDDVFDPNNPDEPVQSPGEEVFELLPVPTAQ